MACQSLLAGCSAILVSSVWFVLTLTFLLQHAIFVLSLLHLLQVVGAHDGA